MSLESQRMEEKKLYDHLYNGGHPSYGGDMHAKNCLEKIKELKIKSIIDVGCGKGQFPIWAKQNGVEKVYGIDFSAKFPKDTKGVVFFSGFAHSLPISDNEVEFVTSFDMMEHLVPDDTNLVLKEFDRVSSKGMIFSISYTPSKIVVNGKNLHPNIHTEDWWIQKLSEFGIVEKYKEYLIVLK